MTGAQASLLALSVRFEREQASLRCKFQVMKRFFASKNDAQCKQDACAPVIARIFYLRLVTA